MADNFLAILEKRKPDIQAMLAEWITADRFFAMAMQIKRFPDLAKCTDESLIDCVIQAAQLGLEIGGPRGHFYVIRYGDQAQGQPGWRGLAFLKLKAGAIMQLDTDVVFKGETFKIVRSGTAGDDFRHEMDFSVERSELCAVAAYARVVLPSGEFQFEVTSRDRVLRHRAHSKQPDGMLWNPKKFWEEGWRKTPYRILDKRLPEGVNREAIERYQQAIEIEARHWKADPIDDTEFPPDNLPPVSHEPVSHEPTKTGPLVTRQDRTVNETEQKPLTDAWKAAHNGRMAGFESFLFQHFGIEDLTDLRVSQIPDFMKALENG